MAASAILSSIVTILTTLLFLTTHHTSAQVAPAPAATPANLTVILLKGGQFTTLLRLLRETRAGNQLENQLNNSFTGFTMFAPTDNAFSNLKPGTLDNLSNQEQVELVLYHVLPQYYTFTTFQTASNPVRTQGSNSAGSDTLNVTSIRNNQVNVSTGLVETQVNNALYSDSRLAVYPVNEVLLPNSLFGAKPPAAAPSSEPAKPGKGPDGSSSALGPASNEEKANTATGLKGRRIWCSFVAGLVGLMSVVGTLL